MRGLVKYKSEKLGRVREVKYYFKRVYFRSNGATLFFNAITSYLHTFILVMNKLSVVIKEKESVEKIQLLDGEQRDRRNHRTTTCMK